MAVQAQYPSNILFLNRSAQEGRDYSLQEKHGLYLDQSHMLFNNGVQGNNNSTNQRKRGREASSSPSAMPFSLQPPQLIDISQLHNHGNQLGSNVVSTGLRLAFGDQQQQIQQQNHHRNQQQQQHESNSSSSLLSVLTENFASQIKQQRDELDLFLQSQLQRALAEKRQRHYRALLTAAEESISVKLRENEAEVQKAMRTNAELEARAAHLSVEAQIWQAKARAQEATAASLQMQVQHAKAMLSSGFHVAAQVSGRVEDGLTCAENEAEDAESGYIDPERVSGPSCKACRKRAATVVLLPCRHCVCTECDGMVQSCPLCLDDEFECGSLALLGPICPDIEK